MALFFAVQFFSNARCTLAKFTDHRLFFCGSRIDAAGNKRKYARNAHVVLVQEETSPGPADVNYASQSSILPELAIRVYERATTTQVANSNFSTGESHSCRLEWNDDKWSVSPFIYSTRWCIAIIYDCLQSAILMWSSHLIKQSQELQFSDEEKNRRRKLNRNHWMRPF